MKVDGHSDGRIETEPMKLAPGFAIACSVRMVRSRGFDAAVLKAGDGVEIRITRAGLEVFKWIVSPSRAVIATQACEVVGSVGEFETAGLLMAWCSGFDEATKIAKGAEAK